ncbi:GDSL-type esterase/lipase family protein [Neorhodopirellula pilleata]|uniref:SGNH hydrolase-type esterase domain-containing protein n=1 Tax=Neorhodopirellula pilleata TaxID=2714738 RepID=A0A5C5ZY01_9BACT|nr:GDSL-type esterase/lipase family protein [Neorhodopirellula pilleata]TWT91891.1 hypothetical protein Pla100_49300 [Neorhodopirellula pilleata]
MCITTNPLFRLFLHACRCLILIAVTGTLMAQGIGPAWSQEASSVNSQIEAPVEPPVEPAVEPKRESEVDSKAANDPNWELLTLGQLKIAVEKWDDEIQKLEQKDQDEPDPQNAVLLLGSSSIRLWENAAGALAPYPVIRRGYGGAKYSDLLVYSRRLIVPHEFRAAVIFVANDITGGQSDHEVEAVEKWVRAIVRTAREHQPQAAILLVEVTPTPSRFDAWSKIRELNGKIREIALTEPNTYFVATAEFYMDRDDQPRAEFFRDDRLHQNEAGYAIWASLIKRRLDEVLSGS